MKRTGEALVLLTVTLIMCGGWFIAGYVIADTDQDFAYDQGVKDGKKQQEALQDMDSEATQDSK